MDPATFNALAEPNRFHIVELLCRRPYPVGEIAQKLHLRQPQASKHLKVLADAKIVIVRPRANKRIYELSSKKFKEIDGWLNRYRNLWKKRFDRLDELLKKEVNRS